ncbi:MAG: hypothetical protein LKE43_08870 [Olsenella sp.]|nr:hypothetical protein [Olsenella sp.]
MRPSWLPAAARRLSRVVAAPAARPAEEVALDGGLPDRPRQLVVLPLRGFLPRLPLARPLGLAEDVGGALIQELVAPLGRQRRRHAVLARHLAQDLLALVDLEGDPHLEPRVVLLPGRLAHVA